MALYQRNGNWWIDYYYQDRRYRQKIGTTKRNAEEALARINHLRVDTTIISQVYGATIPQSCDSTIGHRRVLSMQTRHAPHLENYTLYPWLLSEM